MAVSQRYAEQFEDCGADPQRRQAALVGIDRALQDAGELWHFQVAAIERFNADIRSKRRMKPAEISEAAGRLHSMEGRAAQAFQLYCLVSLLGMRYDGDFGEARILRERGDLERRLGGYARARSDAHMALADKVDGVRGLPLVLADGEEVDAHDMNKAVAAGFIFGGVGGAAIAGALRANAARINPVNMMSAAKEEDGRRRALLMDEISSGDAVKDVEKAQCALLDQMDFVHNRADCMVLDGDRILFLETGEEGE